MLNLFENNGATFSGCRKYRYALWRIWDDQKPLVMFVGLNPSTANEAGDDPTIRSVKRLAKSLGYGGIYMMNLFTFVTPYPDELKRCDDPLGPADLFLLQVAEKCTAVVFAWGKFGYAEREHAVSSMFPNAMCLVKNKDGSPRHPLYVKTGTDLISYFK